MRSWLTSAESSLPQAVKVMTSKAPNSVLSVFMFCCPVCTWMMSMT